MIQLSSNFSNQWEILASYRRNPTGISENNFYGAISWVHGEDLVHHFGQAYCYGRSTMKLFYIKPFEKDLDKVLNISQKALALSSHNGWDESVEIAQSILDRKDLELVKTPSSLPLLQKVGQEVTKPCLWRNNSSGHHAALIRACILRSFDTKDYMSLDHPIFQIYLNTLSQILGESVEDLQKREFAKDGDGLITLVLSVHEIARCYSYLASSKSLSSDWIWKAMTEKPFLVGGVGRLDTAILKSCRGDVLAKEGADGLLALAIKHKEYPKGLGIVIKLAHGWNPQATWFIAKCILENLGFDLPEDAATSDLLGCAWAEPFGKLSGQRAFVSREVNFS